MAVRPRRDLVYKTAPRPKVLPRQHPPKSNYGPPKEKGPRDTLWRWVGWVSLAHLLLFLILCVASWLVPKPQKEQWIDLMPNGSITQGLPSTQPTTTTSTTPSANLSHNTPSPHHTHHPRPITPHETESEPTPVPQHHPEVTPLPHPHTPPPQAEVSPVPDVPVLAPTHVPTHPPTHTPKPVVHTHEPVVDLHEVTRTVDTTADAPEPTAKPKPSPTHRPKAHPTEPPDETNDEPAPSQEEITRQLQERLQGVTHATHIGQSGVTNGHSSDFGGFYASIRDQIYDNWQAPGTVDANIQQPIVQIHVETDGSVPRDQVVLVRSSGNQAYDDSALQAARDLGRLKQSLPQGCSPDIKITFDPNR